jgi:hypothetical protein
VGYVNSVLPANRRFVTCDGIYPPHLWILLGLRSTFSTECTRALIAFSQGLPEVGRRDGPS